jgi:hypothetical protein
MMLPMTTNTPITAQMPVIVSPSVAKIYDVYNYYSTEKVKVEVNYIA